MATDVAVADDHGAPLSNVTTLGLPDSSELAHRVFAAARDDIAPSTEFALDLPCEIGLSFPVQLTRSHVIHHYAALSLRVFMRKPQLLRLISSNPTTGADPLARAVLAAYIPAIDSLLHLDKRNCSTEAYVARLFDRFPRTEDDEGDDNVDNVKPKDTASVDAANFVTDGPVFLRLLASWNRLFRPCIAAINWTSFYETGDLKLTSVASAVSCANAVPNTATAASRSTDGAPGSTVQLTNDELFRRYESFIAETKAALVCLSRQLLLRAASSGATYSALAVRNLVKSQQQLSVDDVRLCCLLFFDLFDLLAKCYSTAHRSPHFVVRSTNHRLLVDAFAIARRELIYARLDFTRRLVTVHRGFSRVKDWVYLRDSFISPLELRYDKLASLLVDCSPAAIRSRAVDEEALRERMFHCTVTTILDVRETCTVLALHNVVVRYLVARYFLPGSRFSDPSDLHDRRLSSHLDPDMAHFFVFLVRRCLGDLDFEARILQPARLTLDACDLVEHLFDSFEFWRVVLAHVAAIAPQTFVAQLHMFVIKHCRDLPGRAAVTVHTLLNYVEWLCSCEPWYLLYSSSVVERLRTIGERKLNEMMVALYEQECLFFYVLIEHRMASLEERLSFVANHVSPRLSRAGTVGHSVGDTRDIDRQSVPGRGAPPDDTAPDFNWRTLFDAMYASSPVFLGTPGHMLRLVREFFRYVLHRQPRDCPNEQVATELLTTIAVLVAKRSDKSGGGGEGRSRGKRSAAGGSSGGDDFDPGDTVVATSVVPAGIPSTTISPGVTRNFRIAAGTEASIATGNAVNSNGPAAISDLVPPLPLFATRTIMWEEADSATSNVYSDVLQKILNFLNATLFMFNGILANAAGSDFMRSFGQKNLLTLMRKEQGVWSKDKLLRLFGPIFKDFDLDTFQQCSRRVPMTSIPNMVIGNCLSNVQQVNTVFVRVSSDHHHPQVIWNLVIRRYEMAAPSVLYLLTLDTANWSAPDKEIFPATPSQTVNEYVSLVLRNMEFFVDDARRADALSMLLYTPLIVKKRIGEADGGVFASRGGSGTSADPAGGMFAKRVASSMMRDVSETVTTTPSTTFNPRGVSTQTAASRDNNTTFDSVVPPCSSSSSSSSSTGGGQASSRYVDFVIDRDEFFGLVDALEPFVVARYCEHLLVQHRREVVCGGTARNRAPRPFLGLLVLMLQLQRVPRFRPFLQRETLAQNLTDVMLLAAVSSDWLRKRKITDAKSTLGGGEGGGSFIAPSPAPIAVKRARRSRRRDNDTDEAGDDVSDDYDDLGGFDEDGNDDVEEEVLNKNRYVDNKAAETDVVAAGSFALFVDRSLAHVDVNLFRPVSSLSSCPMQRRKPSTHQKSTKVAVTTPSATIPTTTAVNVVPLVWTLDAVMQVDEETTTTTTPTSGDAAMSRPPESSSQSRRSSSSLLHDLIDEREFIDRFRQMYSDVEFHRWMADIVANELSIDHVHQLSDTTLLAVFAAYVYVLRVFSDLPCVPTDGAVRDGGATSGSSVSATLTAQMRDSPSEHIRDLQNFFPSRFCVNRRTLDLSGNLGAWLDRRLRAFNAASQRELVRLSARRRQKRSSDKTSGDAATPRTDDGRRLDSTCLVSTSTAATTSTDILDFDQLFDSLVSEERQRQQQQLPQRLLPTESISRVRASPWSTGTTAVPLSLDRVDGVPTLRAGVLDLPSSLRSAVNYVCLVMFLFCDLDLAVTVYLARLVVSFLYPGVESRECVIVRGSSGSGKSQFFDLVREFLNSQSGILTTQAMSNSGNMINTQFIPIGQNFLCQCDEPKRVDNETFKLLISVVPIAARAFQNQIAQSIPILAKLVLTVNNMFQIESDDGILERLHTVFRLSHKHYNLITEQTDMTRYNCGASYNLAHQLLARIYPRDIDKSLFRYGLFNLVHHWSLDQTTRPDASFVLADQMAQLGLCTLLADRERQRATDDDRARCGDDSDGSGARDEELRLRQVWDRLETREGRPPLLASGGRSDREERLSLANMMVVRDGMSNAIFRHQSPPSDAVDDRVVLVDAVYPLSTRSIARNYVLRARHLNDYLRARNEARSLLRYHASRGFAGGQTDVYRDPTSISLLKRYVGAVGSVDRLLATLLSPSTNFLASVSERVGALRSTLAVHQRAIETLESELTATPPVGPLDSDRKMDLSALPCALDLNLVDLQASLDSFVRFKRAFLVEYSTCPVPRDVLHKQLHAYVDEINRSIDDVRYRVRYQEFVDRFETEYAKWRFRRPDNNQFVTSLWSVRLTRVS